MTINSNATYSVELFTNEDNGYKNYGHIKGDIVKQMLRGYKYDADLGMWFTKSGKKGYSITEA